MQVFRRQWPDLKWWQLGIFLFLKSLFGFLYGQTSPHNTHDKWKTMRSNIQLQTKEAVKIRPRWHGGNHRKYHTEEKGSCEHENAFRCKCEADRKPSWHVTPSEWTRNHLKQKHLRPLKNLNLNCNRPIQPILFLTSLPRNYMKYKKIILKTLIK